jgi:hypothetical protein
MGRSDQRPEHDLGLSTGTKKLGWVMVPLMAVTVLWLFIVRLHVDMPFLYGTVIRGDAPFGLQGWLSPVASLLMDYLLWICIFFVVATAAMSLAALWTSKEDAEPRELRLAITSIIAVAALAVPPFLFPLNIFGVAVAVASSMICAIQLVSTLRGQVFQLRLNAARAVRSALIVWLLCFILVLLDLLNLMLVGAS